MKTICVSVLMLFSSQIFAQSEGPCWGKQLPLDPDYYFNHDIENTLKNDYSIKQLKQIYENLIARDYNPNLSFSHDTQQGYICASLWPYFTFIKKGTYTQKELSSATTLLINVIASEEFIEKLNGLTKKGKILPVVKGFNGSNIPNDNLNQYNAFSSEEGNQLFIDIMNNNERVFLSLKNFINEDEKQKSSLKDIEIKDIFELLMYLNNNNHLDPLYSNYLNANGYPTAILSELMKIEN